MKDKLVGTTITTNAEFRNELDVKFAPVSVRLKYKKPDATLVTVTPTADEHYKYSVPVLLDIAGNWKFRWESTSGNTAAKEFTVSVIETLVK